MQQHDLALSLGQARNKLRELRAFGPAFHDPRRVVAPVVHQRLSQRQRRIERKWLTAIGRGDGTAITGTPPLHIA